MKNPLSLSRTQLIRWLGWFLFCNTLLFWLIASHYLFYISIWYSTLVTTHGKVLIAMFMTSAYIGYFALLAYLPAVIIIPVLLIVPRRQLIITLSVIILTIMTTLIAVDTIVYSQYRFHLNGVIMAMIFSRDVHEIFGFTMTEYIMVISAVALLVIIEMVIAYGTWRLFIIREYGKGFGKWIAIIFFFSFYLSWQFLLFSSDTPLFRYLITNARILPFYNNLFATFIPGKVGITNIQHMGNIILTQPPLASKPLIYPLYPLQCQPANNKSIAKKLNIVIIVIDSWRFDLLNRSVTPHIYSFSKHALVYNNHDSGGNGTEPGIFTLFYGLPANYWTATLEQHQRPVLINELIKQHYKLGIFASAELTLPAFNKNVFYGIPDLRTHTPGKTPKKRDATITKEFQRFVTTVSQHKQPFFSFLFYDSGHTYCDDKWFGPFNPQIKTCNRLTLGQKGDRVLYFNRYKNALFYVDKQVELVLQTLKKKNLLNKTVVVITGDHGQEFNDNHLGYWGHASNFTRYQIGTPLVVHWPGKKHQVLSYKTSHYDIVPTLLTRVLHCTNPSSDYSIGKLLSDKSPRKFLIVGSYAYFGVVDPSQIVIIYPTGNYQIETLGAQPLYRAKLNSSIMQQVFRDLNRFYR